MGNKNFLIVALTVVCSILAIMYFSEDRTEFRKNQKVFEQKFEEDVRKFDEQFNNFFGSSGSTSSASTSKQQKQTKQVQHEQNATVKKSDKVVVQNIKKSKNQKKTLDRPKDFDKEFENFEFENFDREFENFDKNFKF